MRFGSSAKWGNSSSLSCILGWVIKPTAKISGLDSWKARQMDAFCLVLITMMFPLCCQFRRRKSDKIWGVNLKGKVVTVLAIWVSTHNDTAKDSQQVTIYPTFILPPLCFCFHCISFYLLLLYYFYTMQLPQGKVVLVNTKEWKEF